jgi:serine/threonine protein kinase/Tol biopolymer transport system component
MTLAAGSRLGPYEVISPLGSGGMGEVYRARDTKLKRDVAVKVLPESLAKDPAALARFEREAHAVAALNHPNILGIYDFGNERGVAYAVMELLEGEDLRSRLDNGALPQRKAIEIAIQIAKGLAAAHEKGVIHRDLKPENLFLTLDGRVKILDFGLAKVFSSETAATNAPTTPAGTEPGTVMGTVGYMSPEQVRGRDVDQRTDIFSFGAILFEMLSGVRAFKRDSAIETLNAILKEEPQELQETGKMISPALDRIVRHCLEKSPESRFHSAGDVAFDLEALSGSTTSSSVGKLETARRSARARKLAAGVAFAVLLAVAYFMGRGGSAPPVPTYQRLTFQRGTIHNARFTPDGQTILYSASWNAHPSEIFSTRMDSTESRPYGTPHSTLLALSSLGELALSTELHEGSGPYWSVGVGTLSRESLAGGSPHSILEGVQFADWSRDGREIAVVRTVGNKNRLEFPIGKVLYETAGWIGNPRISPRGDQVAFLDYTAWGDPGGSVALVDLSGKKKTLASGFNRQEGLAWTPDGSEIWFTATRVGSARFLAAVTPSGGERVILKEMGALTIQDIGPGGAVLMSRDELRREQYALAPGEAAERDLSWHDYSNPNGIAADGRMIAFLEFGDSGGAAHHVYIRKTDGSPAIQIGEGESLALSRDGTKVLAIVGHFSGKPEFLILPTGTGTPRSIPMEPMEYDNANFSPDGSKIFFAAHSPGHASRVFVQDISGGPPRPVTPEGISAGTIDPFPFSPDGIRLVVRDREGRALIWPIAGGSPAPVKGISPYEEVYSWPEPGAVYLADFREIPLKLYRHNLSDGSRSFWKDIRPPDLTGVQVIDILIPTPDMKGYVYSFIRRLSDLFVVRGLK